MDVPVSGTYATQDRPGSWQVSTGYRWQRSHRHFVGSEEQHERAEEGSEVVNRIHLLDVGVRYNLTRRTSFSLGLPFLMADRSSPVRNTAREVVDRSLVQASGISDVTLGARRLMLNPEHCTSGNVSLGVGVKLPTGSSGTTDTRRTFVDGQIVSSVAPVDQSIQPGDGGFGFTVEATAFRRLGTRFATYASGAYLLNPRATNDTDRGGTNPITRYLSVSDQYLARVGFTSTFHGRGTWTTSLGARLEGVPSEDLIGGSEGFRRPGYAVSLEPGVTWRRGRTAITAGLPVALYRNRVKSVADKAAGTHGDAAFADYILILGIARSF